MSAEVRYELPPERIAQRRVGEGEQSPSSRLLHVYSSGEGRSIEFSDRRVSDLPTALKRGDLLVLNNSKVLPARFFFSHPQRTTEVELFLLRRLSEPQGGEDWRRATKVSWEALANPMRVFKPGQELALSPSLNVTIKGRTEDGRRLRVVVTAKETNVSVYEAMLLEGSMPIPPYIRAGRADALDKTEYQTVFARTPGSVAAPTAGLHFSEQLLAELSDAGVAQTEVTLHVGAASILPLENVGCGEDSVVNGVGEEQYEISQESLTAIERTRERGGRVVAVGTTVVRVLETVFSDETFGEQEITPQLMSGWTSITIRPGFSFNAVDMLMTNFHQPRSSHLQLVAAFIGAQATSRLYAHALAQEYRFLSYGDATLLEPNN